ncbi:hypothetical protein X777_01244, partial [Ooceraea biroi]
RKKKIETEKKRRDAQRSERGGEKILTRDPPGQDERSERPSRLPPSAHPPAAVAAAMRAPRPKMSISSLALRPRCALSPIRAPSVYRSRRPHPPPISLLSVLLLPCFPDSIYIYVLFLSFSRPLSFSRHARTSETIPY